MGVIDALITVDVVMDLIKPYVEKVKAEAKVAIKSGIDQWYGAAGPGSYSRAQGFDVFANVTPSEDWYSDGVILTYRFDGPIAVNSWDAPWGVTYSGDGGHAFEKGFIYGLHGGPRPDGAGGWTWANVPQSAPMIDYIKTEAQSISL